MADFTDVTELPEATVVGQTFIHDGHTFVVNPYGLADYGLLGWWEVNATTHEFWPVHAL